MNNGDATLIGLVTELDVFSFTDQSAQLHFKIAPPNGPEQTFVMETATQPQVFRAAATILMNAYQTKVNVLVTFASGTPKAKGVKVPGFPQSR